MLAFKLPGNYSKAKIITPRGAVEFLAGGQQFIAIGTHPTRVRYEWEGGLPSEIPTLHPEVFDQLWSDLAAEFGTTPSKPSAPAPRTQTDTPANLDTDVSISRVDDYLAHEEPAIEDSGGDDRTFQTALTCADMGVSEPVCFDRMLAVYNPRCEPPWAPDDLRTKVRNAYKYRLEAVGCSDPANVFPAVKQDPASTTQHPNDKWLEPMNARYGVVNHQGRTMVHECVHDPELGYTVDEWITFDDFKRRHLNQRVDVIGDFGKPIRKDLGSAWLEHPRRRQYSREAFLPGQTAEADVLNLWHGHAVEAKPGTWPRLREHIRDVICNGDEVADRYVMGWCARLVQKPSEPGQVALVLQGGEGTGKGSFAQALLRLHGRHGAHITQPKHLTGSFNQHLRCVKLLFADEALFAGNHEHRGPLYALITEDLLQIEAKGVDAKPARNALSIVMATNHDWAIPAGVNARRFCVLRVSEKHRQDTEYFRKLRDEMNNGSIEAILHDLLAYDLSQFNVFDVPATEALAMQKILSLRGVESWLFDCLQKGEMRGSDWTAAGLEISKADARADYEAHSKTRREYAPQDLASWGKALRVVIGSAMEERRPRAGERRRTLRFRSLIDCRRAFEQHLRQELPWEYSPEGGAETWTR